MHLTPTEQRLLTLLERYPNGLGPQQLRAKTGYRIAARTIYWWIWRLKQKGVPVINVGPRWQGARYRLVEVS